MAMGSWLILAAVDDVLLVGETAAALVVCKWVMIDDRMHRQLAVNS